jgi:hypothetical protein
MRSACCTQKRFAYLANNLIDAALGTGPVNKRGAFLNCSGTQRNGPTRLLTASDGPYRAVTGTRN